MDMLRIKDVPVDRILESYEYKDVRQKYTYYRTEAEKLSKETDTMRKELDELKASRMSFIKARQEEEKLRWSTLEAEISKLDKELTRIRSLRDQYQQQLEIKTQKEKAHWTHVDQVNQLAETRKTRVSSLEQEVKRLKAQLVTVQAKNGVITATTDPNEISIQVVETLKRLDELRQTLPTPPDKNVDELRMLVQSLEQQVAMHQETESSLLTEIESLTEAWTHLEQQVASKVFDLSSKEKQIADLLGEKAKLERKLSNTTKQRDALSNEVNALKKEIDKKLEIIRTIHELNAKLDNDVDTLHKDLLVCKSQLTDLKNARSKDTLALDSYNRQVTELSKELDTSRKISQERTEEREAARHENNRKEEDILRLKHRLESLAKDGAMDAELVKTNENYKALLKCPSCNNKFKSHVILRCMHVFCLDCIDSRLVTRQRKCPSCAEPFGQADVKQIYL